MKNTSSSPFSSCGVAVLGCGKWGGNIIRNFAQLGVLKGVCDKDLSKAEAVAAQYGVATFSEDEIFKSSAIDAVVIVTDAVAHEAQAQAALQAGKHVYVEKPLALSVEGAQHLWSLAKEGNRVLMVGHILNYHPGFVSLKQHLGQLGTLKHIYANRLSLGRFRYQESILWDLASHDVSLILSLTQTMPHRIQAIGQAYVTPHKPASALLTLTFPEDLTAHIHVSWCSPFKEAKLSVCGDKGIAVFEEGKGWEEKLKIFTNCLLWKEGQCYANDKFGTQHIPLLEEEPLKNESLHFLSCIHQGKEPLTNGEEGVRVTQVLEKAEQSLQTQSPVYI